mgnify:CR=1 FL=1
MTDNPLFDFVTINGRVWAHRHIANGARELVPADGGADIMSESEWEEYCALIRARTKRA